MPVTTHRKGAEAIPKVRVMLVDDSPLFLGALRLAIDNDPMLEVAGTAGNGVDALAKVPVVRPDVIVCDVQMPRMGGIEFLKALLGQQKIPVVVASGTPGVTLTALANGAVDFIAKPAAGEPKEAFFKRVISTIRVAASANVGAKMAFNKASARAVGTLAYTPRDVVVAIGASTGGTDAILAVLRNFPANSPPVVITQHMPVGFTAMYAQRLDRECAVRVSEGKDGARLRAGEALLAPGDLHMRLCRDAQGYFVSCRAGMKVNGHMPSVEVLFESVAEAAGARSVGIILTGMGGDGAEGLLKMRGAGAYTIGQDRATSVVYGMPMMAYNKGAVVKQLPLDEIAGHAVAQLGKM